MLREQRLLHLPGSEVRIFAVPSNAGSTDEVSVCFLTKSLQYHAQDKVSFYKLLG